MGLQSSKPVLKKPPMNVSERDATPYIKKNATTSRPTKQKLKRVQGFKRLHRLGVEQSRSDDSVRFQKSVERASKNFVLHGIDPTNR